MKNKEASKGSVFRKPFVKNMLLAIAVVGVFMLGWGVGSNRITFGLGTKPVAKNLPANLDYTSVNEVYKALKVNFDGSLDTGKLMDGLKSGLVNAAGDPYTEYMTAKEYGDFNSQLNGTFTGIGAELSKENGYIAVVAPISGFPAEKAGLKSKDVITEIDGRSATNLTVSEAVSRIRGPKGTKVKLTIVRNNKEQISLEITRDTINIPSVDYKVENGIGYMHISTFGNDTTELAQKAAKSFKDQNVKGIVLDLRSNPGGLLNDAVDISSLWLPQRKTILTERRDGIIEKTYNATGNSILNGVPTVVLIDSGSASASEITAGALKDNGAATLLGEKSYGKGSVQQLVSLGDGSVLKVTVAKWYTPAGKNINKDGIQPDKKVEITADQIKAGQDPQLEAAKALLEQ